MAGDGKPEKATDPRPLSEAEREKMLKERFIEEKPGEETFGRPAPRWSDRDILRDPTAWRR